MVCWSTTICWRWTGRTWWGWRTRSSGWWSRRGETSSPSPSFQRTSTTPSWRSRSLFEKYFQTYPSLQHFQLLGEKTDGPFCAGDVRRTILILSWEKSDLHLHKSLCHFCEMNYSVRVGRKVRAIPHPCIFPKDVRWTILYKLGESDEGYSTSMYTCIFPHFWKYPWWQNRKQK